MVQGRRLKRHTSIERAGPGLRVEEHRFFTLMSVAMLVATLAGFASTYLLVPLFGMPADSLPFTRLVHLHAAVAFTWCLLFVVQTTLIAAGQAGVHRKLGLASLGLYALLVALGPPVAVHAAARNGSTAEELGFLAVSLGNVLAYTVLFGAGIACRRRPAIHKRLMVLGMVAMLSAPFGRISTFPFLLEHVVGPGVFVLLLAGWDLRSRGAVHPLTLFGGLGVLLWQLAPLAYQSSAWWLALARRMTAAVGEGT